MRATAGIRIGKHFQRREFRNASRPDSLAVDRAAVGNIDDFILGIAAGCGEAMPDCTEAQDGNRDVVVET